MVTAPEGVLEMFGDKLGIVRARAKSDLKPFQSYIESRGQETGGSRGDIREALTFYTQSRMRSTSNYNSNPFALGS